MDSQTFLQVVILTAFISGPGYVAGRIASPAHRGVLQAVVSNRAGPELKEVTVAKTVIFCNDVVRAILSS